jgi:hypothetical protein
VGALDQLRAPGGDGGFVHRVRSNPRLVVAIAAGVVLLLAWIGWAIYVTSADGATAGLGVVIAWPAMVAALALISLPFIGGYLLIRRISAGDDETATAAAASDDRDDDDDPEVQGEEDDEPEEVDGDEDRPDDEEAEQEGEDEPEEDQDAGEDEGDGDEKEPEEAKSS